MIPPTTSDHPDGGALSELARLLDTWGADPGRWPDPARGRIEMLLAGTPGARAVLEDARALDRLLERGRDAPARLPSKAAGALADRIMAAAGASGAAAVSAPPVGARVLAFPASTRLTVATTPSPRPANRRPWQVGGAMAASLVACLVAGLVLGGSLNLAPVVQELVEVAGLSSVIDPALGDDLSEDETL